MKWNDILYEVARILLTKTTPSFDHNTSCSNCIYSAVVFENIEGMCKIKLAFSEDLYLPRHIRENQRLLLWWWQHLVCIQQDTCIQQFDVVGRQRSVSWNHLTESLDRSTPPNWYDKKNNKLTAIQNSIRNNARSVTSFARHLSGVYWASKVK